MFWDVWAFLLFSLPLVLKTIISTNVGFWFFRMRIWKLAPAKRFYLFLILLFNPEGRMRPSGAVSSCLLMRTAAWCWCWSKAAVRSVLLCWRRSARGFRVTVWSGSGLRRSDVPRQASGDVWVGFETRWKAEAGGLRGGRTSCSGCFSPHKEFRSVFYLTGSGFSHSSCKLS